jgi:ferric enterobactin receptor
LLPLRINLNKLMKRYTGFLSILLLVCLNAFGQQSYIKGVIRDLQLKPLHLASIYVVERDLTYYTQNDGSFAIPVWPNQQQLQFVVSMVDKKAQVIIVKKADYAKVLQIQLKDLSYTLEDVRINPVQKTTVHSNSSIVFDEEAIERVQAFSLMDVLKTLPGKASTAPNLDAPQTLTLRGALGGNYDLNNSLGIPIIMDGVTLSNDANMQARSVSQFGMSGSILSGAKNYSGGDVPFQGIDLRDIPVETIEQIEVIQGVASARFGELTDGAILIQRKAGKTPFSFTTNIHAGSSNYSLSKGFALPSKAGALNLSTNYALSNPDPRDRVKAYSRVGGNVMWSYTLGSGFRNTLSIDGHKRLDEVKMDPDDDTQQMSRTKNAGFSISNRSQWLTSLPWLSTLQWTLAYSQSSQDSYKPLKIQRVFMKGCCFQDAI